MIKASGTRPATSDPLRLKAQGSRLLVARGPWHMSAMLIKDAQRGVANVTTTWGPGWGMSVRRRHRQPRGDFHLTLQSVASICLSFFYPRNRQGIRVVIVDIGEKV